jgi:hypothetical protein
MAGVQRHLRSMWKIAMLSPEPPWAISASILMSPFAGEG